MTQHRAPSIDPILSSIQNPGVFGYLVSGEEMIHGPSLFLARWLFRWEMRCWTLKMHHICIETRNPIYLQTPSWQGRRRCKPRTRSNDWRNDNVHLSPRSCKVQKTLRILIWFWENIFCMIYFQIILHIDGKDFQ